MFDGTLLENLDPSQTKDTGFIEDVAHKVGILGVLDGVEKLSKQMKEIEDPISSILRKQIGVARAIITVAF